MLSASGAIEGILRAVVLVREIPFREGSLLGFAQLEIGPSPPPSMLTSTYEIALSGLVRRSSGGGPRFANGIPETAFA